MSAAYFIVLDNSDSGFDPFVNGKAIARETEQLSRIASYLGLKTPDDYVSMSGEDVGAMAAEFDIGEDIPAAAEQWFDPSEGLTWIRQLRAHVQSNQESVDNPAAVVADLTAYERVLSQAKSVGAKWHLSVDI
jgi:hypothetical protein